jgi:hypothetical protein
MRANPIGAHDSLPPMSADGIDLLEFCRGGAYDTAPLPAEGALADLVAFLQTNLPRTAVAKGTSLLKTLCEYSGVDHENVDLDYRADIGMDRKPTARRAKLAHDRADDVAAFNQRYPDAARIRVMP